MIYVCEDDDLMLVTDGGQIIRTRVNDIRIAGRATMGVIVFRLDGKKEKVVSAKTVPYMENDEEEIQPTDGIIEQVQEPVNEQ